MIRFIVDYQGWITGDSTFYECGTVKSFDRSREVLLVRYDRAEWANGYDEAKYGAPPEQSPPQKARDSLIEIKGIGKTMAVDLAQLGILTFGDLANADAAKLGAQLKASERQIRGWIEAARKRV